MINHYCTLCLVTQLEIIIITPYLNWGKYNHGDLDMGMKLSNGFLIK
jgi:hypothetical protein